MPWKECNRMEERLRFVARLLDGEKMAVVWQFLPINKNRTCDHLIKSQLAYLGFSSAIQRLTFRVSDRKP